MSYTKTAITLHWLIALLIIAQIACGFWMVDAVKVKATQSLAFDMYQWHKTAGICVLLLSIVRLIWRLTHRAPALPDTMKSWEKRAAHGAHVFFYMLMIGIPLTGWAMVSTSPYGLPTLFFGQWEWPHITSLMQLTDVQAWHQSFKDYHYYLAYGTALLLLLHVGAALKHHFIIKDDVLTRMVPFLRRRNDFDR